MTNVLKNPDKCLKVKFYFYRTVSIYGEVWDMVEERALQLAPPPGVAALDPLMQLQQNLAALNQVNQAIGK